MELRTKLSLVFLGVILAFVAIVTAKFLTEAKAKVVTSGTVIEMSKPSVFAPDIGLE